MKQTGALVMTFALVATCYAAAAEYAAAPEPMTVKDLLPWLNALLIPGVYWIIRGSMAVQEALTLLKAHDNLDTVRFEALDSRLKRIEGKES